jgi:hypothetical protein
MFFFNKSDCLKYASQFNTCNVQYNYLDSVYRTLDWNTEPAQDLDKLYLERAIQLRDKYDYLILAFSGGADSRNILKTFTNNNIKLDEIYTFQASNPIERLRHTFRKDANDEKDIIFEYLEAALPELQQVAIHHPEIKITVADITEDSIKTVDDSKVHVWFRGGSTATPQTAGYYKLTELMRQRAGSYQRVACITGLDKPRIGYNKHAKKFMSQYNDLTNAFADYTAHDLDFPAVMENFYYTPDLPTLNQKQCFVLKNEILRIIKNNPLAIKSLLAKENSNALIFNTHHDHFKKLLYKTWDSTIWQAKKHSNFFYSAHTDWFYNSDITSSRTKDFYDKQVLELVHGINERYVVYENGKPSLLTSFMTNPINF